MLDKSLNTMADLRIAVICSSNQNRSMEAHNFLRYESQVKSSLKIIEDGIIAALEIFVRVSLSYSAFIHRISKKN